MFKYAVYTVSWPISDKGTARPRLNKIAETTVDVHNSDVARIQAAKELDMDYNNIRTAIILESCLSCLYFTEGKGGDLDVCSYGTETPINHTTGCSEWFSNESH